MRFLQLIFFLLLSNFFWGQVPPQIDWGPENLARPNTIAILPKDNGIFFTFHYGNGSLMPSAKISRFENGKEIFSKRIEPRIDQKMVTLEDMFLFSNRLFGLFSDKIGPSVTLYMQEYDDDVDPFGPPLVVASYVIPKGWSRNVLVTTKVSPENNFLVVDYLIPAKKEPFDRFGYNILNKQMVSVREGEYEIPYESNLSAVEARHLTDKGDYFLGVSVFSKAYYSVWKDFGQVDKSVLIHMSPGDSLKMYELDLEQRKVYNFVITSNDSNAIVTGTWGGEDSRGAKGVFYSSFSLDSNRLELPKFLEFPAEILDQENPQTDDIYSYQNINGELLNYAFRNVILLPDGSINVLAEQYYIYEVNTTDSRGMNQVTNYYNYNDCIVYSLSHAGELNWFRKIPKKQESVNDFGQFSSLISYVSKGNLVIFFNDHIQNYDQIGEYLGTRIPFSNTLRYKEYCLAKARVNLESGETQRVMFSPYDAIEAFVCLKLSCVNYSTHQVIFAASNKRDKYGFLTFE
ncbi:hypothetical protein [Fluviicola chungangensis]|uniref:Uncharacterized protein n=1 Tax=Fluviicola chungangensis TaxID=2597671 RepID=A0A556N0V9_9FLAO|nr:hypothetical protein [Fluviicola chungangensis]TSJ45834.1 hypothetical protein FO442_08795 [Fluviicola chungangensis]